MIKFIKGLGWSQTFFICEKSKKNGLENHL